MKVVTKNEEELNVKEIHVENSKGLSAILFPNQVHRFVFEEIDKTDEDLNHYELARFGHISVAFKTFLNGEANKDDIELSLWDNNFKFRYTIATFKKDYEDSEWVGYELVSCGQRLDNKDINYSDFGKAVHYAFQYLDKYYDRKNKED